MADPIFEQLDLRFSILYPEDVVPSDDLIEVAPIDMFNTGVAWYPKSPTFEPVLIQKSEVGKDYDFVTLAQFDPRGNTTFTDSTANNSFHRLGSEYYRVILLDSKQVIGPGVSVGKLDPMGAEIARRHNVRLSGGQEGRKMFIFPRMRQGVRCPKCWDTILKKRSNSRCEMCANTGWIGGFYGPIPLFVALGTESTAQVTDLEGPSNSKTTVQGWVSNFPAIYSGDVIIDPEGHFIWEVTGVDVTLMKRVVVRQTFTVERMTQDDEAVDLLKRLPEFTSKAPSLHKEIKKRGTQRGR